MQNMSRLTTIIILVAALSVGSPMMGVYAQTDDDMMMVTDSPLEGTITIGALITLTGEAASFGNDMRAATELAIEDFNDYLESYGATWRLGVTVEDSATNPVIALEKVQAMHSQGVELVVGPFTSANVQNIKGYADANGLLVMSPSSTTPALAIPGDNVYRMVPDDSNQGKAIGKLFERDGLEAMVPIWRGEIYGDGLQTAAAKSFESRGGFVHDGVRYTPDAPELSLEVSALADAVQEMVDKYGADKVGVFMISFDEFLLIVQSASQHEILTQVKWYGAESVAEHESFISDGIAAEFAEQVDITSLQILIGLGERYDSVKAELTERLGMAPNSFAYPTYDSVWVIGKSIMKTGSTNVDDIMEVLPEIAAAHDGTVASNELNEAGDLALANYQIWKIVDDAWDVRGKYSVDRDILSAETTPEGEVEVGVIYPLTGRLSSKGAENLAGTQLGAEDFNAFLKSINEEWELALTVEDSETDPNAALEKAQALLSRGISIIIGPETSGNTGQVKPYADTNDMMLISCCSTAPSLAIAGDSVYRLVPDDSKQGVAVGSLLYSSDIIAVVPIWRGDAYGDGLRDAVKMDFESRGGFVHEGIRYTPDAADFSGEVATLADQVQMMVDEYGAQQVAVLIIAFDESVQLVQGSANYDILDDVRWFGSESLTKGTPLIEDRIARDFVNRVQFTSMQIAENRGEVYERVTNHILDKYGNLPTTFVYQAYDASWLVGLSILETGSSDAASVKSVFHDVATGYSGALGATTLNEAGDLAAADYAIWNIAGNTWVEIGKYSLLADAITMRVMVDGTGFAPDFVMTGGDVSAMSTNPQENTLIINMDATKDGSLTITLPRALIDSKLADEADDSFFVLVDGKEAGYVETESTSDSRTIQIEFVGGSETVEVIGTWAAVPEFGAIAALVLAAAIMSIVVITSKSGLSIVYRRF
ncbi:MAG: ABC transporter substrate-binding protein [Cenarchaeum sp. SB0661_bin_35]|nr:ABC transporter substrate-binding protein [Cenarchaeum sp. SB0667_bin_13]MYC80147.1 ABC transporter substrate-binding protein [Cenarchaeum sp. SB0661_bin_35]